MMITGKDLIEIEKLKKKMKKCILANKKSK